MTLVVGQELWYVPESRYGKQHIVKIEKIGRKWAEVDRGLRIDKNTLWVDGGKYTTLGRCWLSKEAYEARIATERAWTAFSNIVRHKYRVPDGVTVEKIAQAAELLGINL